MKEEGSFRKFSLNGFTEYCADSLDSEFSPGTFGDLKFPNGTLTFIISYGTGWGKSSALTSLAIYALKSEPERKIYYFPYSESGWEIIEYLMLCYAYSNFKNDLPNECDTFDNLRKALSEFEEGGDSPLSKSIESVKNYLKDERIKITKTHDFGLEDFKRVAVNKGDILLIDQIEKLYLNHPEKSKEEVQDELKCIAKQKKCVIICTSGWSQRDSMEYNGKNLIIIDRRIGKDVESTYFKVVRARENADKIAYDYSLPLKCKLDYRFIDAEKNSTTKGYNSELSLAVGYALDLIKKGAKSYYANASAAKKYGVSVYKVAEGTSRRHRI